MATNSPPDQLLTAEQVAHYLGIARQTLYNMRLRGHGPVAIKLGEEAGVLRYHQQDVDDWLNQQRETEVGR